MSGVDTMNNTVLLVGNFPPSEIGFMSVSEQLAKRLSANGWRVVTTSREVNRLSRLLDMIKTVWRQRGLCDVALVEVFSGKAFVWAEVVCWLLGRVKKPYILTLHGGGLPTFANRWPGRVRRLLRSAAAVTAPSHYAEEKLKGYCEHIEVLPNPIEVTRYQVRLGTDVEPRLIWVRAFHRIYNPSLAPRVISILVKAFPEVTLMMIGRDKGDGSLQDARKCAEDLGVSQSISFLGGVRNEDIPQWLNKACIFLNTTNFDNVPVSVLEAMASGLCIVSTNVGGLPYLLDHGKDGYLVPPDDPQAMADAIEKVLRDPVLAHRLSSAARKKAERFDWSVILPSWESTIRATIGGKRQ